MPYARPWARPLVACLICVSVSSQNERHPEDIVEELPGVNEHLEPHDRIPRSRSAFGVIAFIAIGISSACYRIRGQEGLTVPKREQETTRQTSSGATKSLSGIKKLSTANHVKAGGATQPRVTSETTSARTEHR